MNLGFSNGEFYGRSAGTHQKPLLTQKLLLQAKAEMWEGRENGSPSYMEQCLRHRAQKKIEHANCMGAKWKSIKHKSCSQSYQKIKYKDGHSMPNPEEFHPAHGTRVSFLLFSPVVCRREIKAPNLSGCC